MATSQSTSTTSANHWARSDMMNRRPCGVLPKKEIAERVIMITINRSCQNSLRPDRHRPKEPAITAIKNKTPSALTTPSSFVWSNRNKGRNRKSWVNEGVTVGRYSVGIRMLRSIRNAPNKSRSTIGHAIRKTLDRRSPASAIFQSLNRSNKKNGTKNKQRRNGAPRFVKTEMTTPINRPIQRM